MEILIYTLIISFLRPDSSHHPTMLLQGFIRDIASHQMSNAALEKKYFFPALLQQTDDGEKLRAIADYYFSALRMELDEQQIKTEELVFISFDSLPDKKFEIIGDTRQVYVSQYHGEILDYFLVQDNKISSFTLFRTGKRAFFVTYCD